MSKKQKNTNLDFLSFLKYATSPYHAILSCSAYLEESGFERLDFTNSWKLEPGMSYYTILYGTTLFAFQVGKQITEEYSKFHIIASHTDHPGFRIKPNPCIYEKGYLKLNTETYGGAILNSWFDRPLSIAGKVVLKSDKVFQPKIQYFDYQLPLLTIPNLAIHMNHKINSGVELNKQQDMLPIFSLEETKDITKDYFLSFLSKELEVSYEDILDYDLSIYNLEQGCKLGLHEEFLSAPRIDNLSSVYASLKAISQTAPLSSSIITVAAFYDNEEVGSSTKQGADSYLTQIIMEKIYQGLSFSRDALNNSIARSFLLSADVAHGYHPNYGNKSDPTNLVSLGNGVVLKMNSSQRYATDSEAIGAIMQLCNLFHIPYQKFVNRSDMAGGSTLGSILSSHLPIHTVDLGIPVLAMHSARETACEKDLEALSALCLAFYQHH
ncbi:MAG: M18 family aminopeptidase [Lachnospiraceae bacterium]|nr:M18 family aminopeptidase [Lachnospiraceae bacterium]